MGLKDYAKPRGDLFDEALDAQLAPSLAEAYLGRGHELYRSSDLFFAATYLSEAMRRVLREVAEAVQGRGARRVFPLFSLYGGGKTHLLVAIVHASRSPSSLAKLDSELAKLYAEARPKIVVLDGESDELCPSPAKPLNVGPYQVRTVWGSLAHQLGRYSALRVEDEKVFAPSAEALHRLLGDEPAIILVDEIAKYATRFLESGDEALRGYGRNVVAFLESLARAVEGTRAALVVTLPLEVREGEERYVEAYRDAARMIREGIGRVVASYDVPLRSEEIVEVLKRRIFERIDEGRARELRSRYLSLYGSEQQVFGAAAVERAAKLDACAPFHPSYLEVLYDIVTMSPELQRTRDALRITRIVVRRLLQLGEDSDLIMPWHIDLADDRIRGFVLTQSFASFGPVVDKDLMDRARAGDPRGLLYRVALSIFLRTYVYGSVLRPERVFPTREDVAFMVYEEMFAARAGIKPADVFNALEAAGGLLYLQERDGRFWFNPIRSVIEIVEEEAGRVSPVEARKKLLEVVEKLAEGPPPGTPKKEAAPPLFKWYVRDEPLPLDEPGYHLVIATRKLSRDEVRRIIFERERGGERVYRNTVAVLYPGDERRLARLLELCSKLIACDRVGKELKGLYTDEDARELQGRKLREYERRIESQLYNEILAAYDTIAFPRDHDVYESSVSPRRTSLARMAEEALASYEVGKARLDRLDFEELDYMMKSIGVDLSEGGRELTVKEVIEYFYTNPRLPFVRRDLLLHALQEGVSNLSIGVQRGGELFWARIYLQGEELPFRPEGRVPDNILETDLVLPWRIAAARLLEKISKPQVVEELDRKVRVSHVLIVDGQEVSLAELAPAEAVKMLKQYPVVRKREELRQDVLVELTPRALSLAPGEAAEVAVSVEPVGAVAEPVTLNVDYGRVEPESGLLPLKAVWRLRAPEEEGSFTYRLTVEVPGLRRRAVSELAVKVQAAVAAPQQVRGFLVRDLEDLDRLVRSGRFALSVLEEGFVRLERGEVQASLNVRGCDPQAFIETVRVLMSAVRIYAPKEFNALLRLEKPVELSEEVKRELSKYRSVEPR